MTLEVWLPVVGFEGRYDVSNLGRLRSYVANDSAAPVILKPSRRSGGYYRYTLAVGDGSRAQICAHHLVLVAFVGPCPQGMECRHLNGHRHDNVLTNLCWGTKLENAADKRLHGTMCRGESHGRSKVTADQVMEIRRAYAAGGVRQIDLAERYGIAQTKISAIVRGERWSHLPKAA